MGCLARKFVDCRPCGAKQNCRQKEGLRINGKPEKIGVKGKKNAK
jgi:hypothetical protein